MRLAVKIRRRVVLAPPRNTSMLSNLCFGFSRASQIFRENGGEAMRAAFGKNECANRSESTAHSLTSSAGETGGASAIVRVPPLGLVLDLLRARRHRLQLFAMREFITLADRVHDQRGNRNDREPDHHEYEHGCATVLHEDLKHIYGLHCTTPVTVQSHPEGGEGIAGRTRYTSGNGTAGSNDLHITSTPIRGGWYAARITGS